MSIMLAILALSLMTIAYTFKRGYLMWAAAPAWLIFGLYNRSLSTQTWDLYFGLFLIASVGMVLLCIVEAVLIKPKKQDVKEDMYAEDLDRKTDAPDSKGGTKGGQNKTERKPRTYFH